MTAAVSGTRRDKFNTRRFRLVGKEQVEAARTVLGNLPIDADAPIEVVIQEAVKGRGLDANAYYWKRLTEIADQAWVEGRQYSKEVWHEYARQNLMPETVITKDGAEISKWLPSPDGRPVVISTTQLERKCFAQYTEIVESYGASMGVMFSAHPNEV